MSGETRAALTDVAAWAIAERGIADSIADRCKKLGATDKERVARVAARTFDRVHREIQRRLNEEG